MAFDKVVDSSVLDENLKTIADAIRSKTGSSDKLTLDQMADAIDGIEVGGDSEAAEMLFSVIEKSDKPLTKLPEGLKVIGVYSLRGHLGLTLTSLPESVTEIRTQALSYCDGLTQMSLPAALTKIENYGFYNCKNLAQVTFHSTPTSVSANVFEGCTNLITINVPWSEGAVKNAPWGAVNATIHYNYTGG